MNMDKYFIWIHYERLHNHNKANHNKTVCIFLGIYCINASVYRIIIGSGDGLSPSRLQAITWTDADLLSIGKFPWFKIFSGYDKA